MESWRRPGDILSDEITLRNTTNSDAEFFFRTAFSDSLSDEAVDLLEQIFLEITLGDELLYRGRLKSTALEEAISLGIYKSGETESFQIKMH